MYVRPSPFKWNWIRISHEWPCRIRWGITWWPRQESNFSRQGNDFARHKDIEPAATSAGGRVRKDIATILHQCLTAIKRRNRISPLGLSLCTTIPYLSFIPYIVVYILCHFFSIRKIKDWTFLFFFFCVCCNMSVAGQKFYNFLAAYFELILWDWLVFELRWFYPEKFAEPHFDCTCSRND